MASMARATASPSGCRRVRIVAKRQAPSAKRQSPSDISQQLVSDETGLDWTDNDEFEYADYLAGHP